MGFQQQHGGHAAPFQDSQSMKWINGDWSGNAEGPILNDTILSSAGPDVETLVPSPSPSQLESQSHSQPQLSAANVDASSTRTSGSDNERKESQIQSRIGLGSQIDSFFRRGFETAGGPGAARGAGGWVREKRVV